MKTHASHIDTFTNGEEVGTTSYSNRLAASTVPLFQLSCLAQPALSTVSQVPAHSTNTPREKASFKSMRDRSKTGTKPHRTTPQPESTVRLKSSPTPAGEPARPQHGPNRGVASSTPTSSSPQQKALQAASYRGEAFGGKFLPHRTPRKASTRPTGDRRTQANLQPGFESISTLPEAQHAFLVHAANAQPGSAPLYGRHHAISRVAPQAHHPRLVLQPGPQAYIAPQPVLAHVAVDAAGAQPAHQIHAPQLLLHCPQTHPHHPVYHHKYATQAAVSAHGAPVNMVLLAAPHIVAVPNSTQAQHQLSPRYMDHAVMNVTFHVPQHQNDVTASGRVHPANVEPAAQSVRTKAKKPCAKRNAVQSSAKAAAKPRGKRGTEVGSSAQSLRIAHALNCAAVDAVGRHDVPIPAIPLGWYMAPHSDYRPHKTSQCMPARDTRGPSHDEDEYTVPQETIDNAAAALMTSQPVPTTNYTSATVNDFGSPVSAADFLNHPHLPSLAKRGGIFDSMPVAGFCKQRMIQDRSAFKVVKRAAALQQRAVSFHSSRASGLERLQAGRAPELKTPSRLPRSNIPYTSTDGRRLEGSVASSVPIRRSSATTTVAEQLRQLLNESNLKNTSSVQNPLDKSKLGVTRQASQFTPAPCTRAAPAQNEDEYIIPQETIDRATAALMTSQQVGTMNCPSTTASERGNPASAAEAILHSHFPSFADRSVRTDGRREDGHQKQKIKEDRSAFIMLKRAAALAHPKAAFDTTRTLGLAHGQAECLNEPTTPPPSSLQQGNRAYTTGDTCTTPRVEDIVANSIPIRPPRTPRLAEQLHQRYTESNFKYSSSARESLGQSKIASSVQSPIASEAAGSLPHLQPPHPQQPAPNAMKKNSTTLRKRRRQAAIDVAVMSTKSYMIDKLDVAHESEDQVAFAASIPQSPVSTAASQGDILHKDATTDGFIDNLIEPGQQRQAPSFQPNQASKLPTEEFITTAPPFPEDLPSELLDSIPDLEDEPPDWQDLTYLDTAALEAEAGALGLDVDSPPRAINLQDSVAQAQIPTRREEDFGNANAAVSWAHSAGDNLERPAKDGKPQPKEPDRRCLKLKFNCSGPSQFDLALQDDDDEDYNTSTVQHDTITRKRVRTVPREHKPSSEQNGTRISLFAPSPARDGLSGTLVLTAPTKHAKVVLEVPKKPTSSIIDEAIAESGDRSRSKDDQRHWQGRKDRLGRLSTRNLELREQFASTCGLCHHRLDVDDDVIRCAGSIEPCSTAVHAHCAFASGPGIPRFRGDIPSPERWRCRKCTSTDVWASPGKLAPVLPDD